MEKCELSSEQIKYYATLAYNRDRHAEEILLSALQPYVTNIAQLYLNNLQQYSALIDLDDLIQEGMLGLLTALHECSPKQYNRFYSNASLKIRTAIKNYIQKKLNKDKNFITSGCTLNSCTQIEDSTNVIEDAIFSLLSENLNEVDALTEQEKQVLILRYKYKFTLLQIANELKISRSRVGEIENKALIKLRNYLVLNKIIGIKDYKAYEQKYFESLSELNQLRYIVNQVVLKYRDFSSLCATLNLDEQQVKEYLFKRKKTLDPTLYEKLVTSFNGQVPIIEDNFQETKFELQESSIITGDNFSIRYNSKIFSDGMLMDIAFQIVRGKLLKDICVLHNLNDKKVIIKLQECLNDLSVHLYDQLFELGYVKFKRKKSDNLVISSEELLYIATQIVKKGKSLFEVCAVFKLDINFVNNQLQERLPYLSKDLYDGLASLGYITFGTQKRYLAKLKTSQK